MALNQDIDQTNDLPLLANAHQIRARHYMLKLQCHLQKQIFEGQIIIFLQPMYDVNICSKEKSECDIFNCILDCQDLDFISVEEVETDEHEAEELCSNFELRKSRHIFDTFFDKTRKKLEYRVEKWAICIHKENVFEAGHFPKVLFLHYKTRPCGKSLLWRKTQDNFECVFTPAATINNRSLFPCQEPPIAMATWQATIVTSDPDLIVLTTGDVNGEIETSESGLTSHYFYTVMVLPMSTFALAIGKWKMFEILPQSHSRHLSHNQSCELNHEPYPCHIERGDSGPHLPCRLYGPEQILEPLIVLLKIYLPACLQAAYELLGSHPFLKLDILVLPRCYSGLGLASPSLMFISQSVLINVDASMLVRFAHEISHSWFGLVIGALDWTEEWLSEGFATFSEDHIHSRALQIINKQDLSALEDQFSEFIQICQNDLTFFDQVSALRSVIRFKTLNSELENTETELQILRPMRGNELVDVSSGALYVKNGNNSAISYTQVHYLKGYFLLRTLCEHVGIEKFFALLRHYIHELYHGQLVHSTDFLSLFFTHFSGLYPGVSCQENVDKICQVWLDTPHLPNDLKTKFDLNAVDSKLSSDVIKATKFWKDVANSKRRKYPLQIKPPKLQVPEQVVLLLENLLMEDKLTLKFLQKLDQHFSFTNANADIQHRWCELQIKHGYLRFKDSIVQFLREHQAMGIYLYSEMVISKNKSLQKLSHSMFRELREEMDSVTVDNVTDLLYPT